MKVVIVGGYGVFGALTAQLLARDGHQLWLAGRHPDKARRLAQEIGAQTLRVDLQGDPSGLFAVEPDLVIDAAGPFQDYGAAPYRLPQLCIAQGCSYLDLSDSAAFTGGIAALDAQAKAAGCVVLSGASSVPGLSSVVVADMIRGLEDVDLIDIAILPGNRAPRGMSVIKSIVGGVGRPFQHWREGAWHPVAGWTDRKLYHLGPDLCRAGYLVDVPDLTLLPPMTQARSVIFRAGLELPVMNSSLALLARLRRRWALNIPEIGYRALHLLAKLLYPFGSDRGGMQVTVTGRCAGRDVTRRWTLVAEHGDGPFVPGIMCRAIARNLRDIPVGARPCLAALPRQTVEDAMSDLRIAITTEGLTGAHPVLDVA